MAEETEATAASCHDGWLRSPGEWSRGDRGRHVTEIFLNNGLVLKLHTSHSPSPINVCDTSISNGSVFRKNRTQLTLAIPRFICSLCCFTSFAVKYVGTLREIARKTTMQIVS